MSNKEDGIHTEYHSNGQKKSEGHYIDGKKVGEWSYWDEEDGHLEKIFRFLIADITDVVKGKVFCIQESYYDSEDVKRKSLELYFDDKKGCYWHKWHENGRVKERGEYKDDKKTGDWHKWHENGQERSLVYYSDGKKNTNRDEWHSNGNKKIQEFYRDDIRQGRQTSWDFNGYIINEKIYRNGELIKTIEIDKQHKIKKFLNVADIDGKISRFFDAYLQDVCEKDSVLCEWFLTKHAMCGFDANLFHMTIDGRYADNIAGMTEEFDGWRPRGTSPEMVIGVDGTAPDPSKETDPVKAEGIRNALSYTHLRANTPINTVNIDKVFIEEHILIAFDRFLKQVSDIDPVYYKSLRSKHDKGVFNDRLEKLNGITDMADLFDEFGEF